MPFSEEQLEEAVDEAFSHGGEIMPTIVQRIKNEMAEKYRDELASARNEAAREKEEIAKKLMMHGMNADEIVSITGLSMEKLKKIISVTH